MTNLGASIALPKIKLQTCQAQTLKPHTYISMLRARQLNPIEEYWDDKNQRSSRNWFVCRRRHGLCSFTGITLRVQVHTELALRVINVSIVHQHNRIASRPSILSAETPSRDNISLFLGNQENTTPVTNLCARTALPNVKLQTCQVQKMKAQTCISGAESAPDQSYRGILR